MTDSISDDQVSTARANYIAAERALKAATKINKTANWLFNACYGNAWHNGAWAHYVDVAAAEKKLAALDRSRANLAVATHRYKCARDEFNIASAHRRDVRLGHKIVVDNI